MAGIAGIGKEGRTAQVKRMLDRISHRGEPGSKIIESHGSTLGAVWLGAEAEPAPSLLREQAVWDGTHPPLPEQAALETQRDPFALTAATSEGMLLARDPLGVCPLYYGRTEEGHICFASEVKALLDLADDIREFPPGRWYDDQVGFQTYFEVEPQPDLSQDPGRIAGQLRLRLERAISRQTDEEATGCWLSGNLTSSALAALARPHVNTLHTFAVGTPGTPDLESARKVATLLQTEHHEITVTLDEVLEPLPAVIWYLESFDVPLVRASVSRFLAAKRAADHVGTVVFDEGANLLLGGSPHNWDADPTEVVEQTIEGARTLHNTALQRVDRTASSHGLVAQVPFLDLDVFEYAVSIPSEFKLRRNGEAMDRWILRKALSSVLPADLLQPPATSLWQGAGVGFLLALSAEDRITDEEFYRERVLPAGWTLRDKEELMYYRIFREQFGELQDLSWMGRQTPMPDVQS
jgi:asparagine synthase (glutamine-hydrolysing)